MRRNLAHTLVIAAAGLTLVACGEAPSGFGSAVTPSGSALGSSVLAITGGEPDEGHPAVGVLLSSTSEGLSLCSATVVGRQSVITAGHCVPSNEVEFRTCIGVSECDEASASAYPAARIVRHPGWLAGNRRYDIALVTLQRPVTGVEPKPISLRAPQLADPVTLVGFGKPGFGTRRVAQNTISALGASQFQFQGTEAVVDEGDSGGPTFIAREGEEVLAGVHSTKHLAQVGGEVVIVGTDIRVDIFYSWIVDQFAGDVALEGIGLPEQGNSPAAPAAEGESCWSRTCAADLVCTPVSRSNGLELGRYCMERCTTEGQDAACEGQETCTASRSSGLVCFASESVATGFTSGATTQTPIPDPSSVEESAAAPDPATKPAPASDPDIASEPGTGVTADPESTGDAPTVGLLFGEICEESTDCQSGICAPEPTTGTRYCTHACSEANRCDDGASCVLSNDGEQSVCSPPLLLEERTLQLNEDTTTPAQPELARMVGGCSTAPRPGRTLHLVLLLALLLCARTTRQTRR